MALTHQQMIAVSRALTDGTPSAIPETREQHLALSARWRQLTSRDPSTRAERAAIEQAVEDFARDYGLLPGAAPRPGRAPIDPADAPPGSEEAVALGCRCPRGDNAHGRGYTTDRRTGETLYVFSAACPLHRPAALAAEREAMEAVERRAETRAAAAPRVPR